MFRTNADWVVMKFVALALWFQCAAGLGVGSRADNPGPVEHSYHGGDNS